MKNNKHIVNAKQLLQQTKQQQSLSEHLALFRQAREQLSLAVKTTLKSEVAHECS